MKKTVLLVTTLFISSCSETLITTSGVQTNQSYSTVIGNSRTFTINLDSDGGSSVKTLILKEGETIFLVDPFKQGFDFNGWFYEDSTTEFKLENMPSKDIRLKAKWSKNIDTIKWELFNISREYYINNEEIPIKMSKSMNSTFTTYFSYYMHVDLIYVSHEHEYKNLNTVIKTGVKMKFDFGDLYNAEYVDFYSVLMTNNNVQQFTNVEIYNLDYISYDDIRFNYNVKYDNYYKSNQELENTIRNTIRSAYVDVSGQLLVKHKFWEASKLWHNN